LGAWQGSRGWSFRAIHITSQIPGTQCLFPQGLIVMKYFGSIQRGNPLEKANGRQPGTGNRQQANVQHPQRNGPPCPISFFAGAPVATGDSTGRAGRPNGNEPHALRLGDRSIAPPGLREYENKKIDALSHFVSTGSRPWLEHKRPWRGFRPMRNAK